MVLNQLLSGMHILITVISREAQFQVFCRSGVAWWSEMAQD